MRTPFFIELSAGSLVRVEHSNVTFAKFSLHARVFLTGLRPACGHADCEKDGNVGGSERRTGQQRPNPMSDVGPRRPRGWCLHSFGSFDAPPNRFLKTRRKRGVRAPLLEHLAECLLVIAWFVGLHVTSTMGGASSRRPLQFTRQNRDRDDYLTGAIWISLAAFSRHAVSKRGSLGESVGRGACTRSTFEPVPGTLRSDFASSLALGEPALTERSIMSSVVPGIFLSESARAFALGDISGSPAFAPAAKLRTPATATASKRGFFIIVIPFFVVAAFAALNH